MSEWDKLNRFEKARITRGILYGRGGGLGWIKGCPRGPMSEETKEKIRQTKKKEWADMSPEVKEERMRGIYWANLSPEQKKERGRAISEGLKKSEKFKEAIKTRGIKDPETWRKNLRDAMKKRREKYGNPAGVRDYEAHCRAISDGLRRAKKLRESRERGGK